MKLSIKIFLGYIDGVLLKGEDVTYLDDKVDSDKLWLQEFWKRAEDMQVEGVI